MKRKIFLVSGSKLDANTASAARLRNYRGNINQDKFDLIVLCLQDYYLFNFWESKVKDAFILRLALEAVFSLLLIIKTANTSRAGDVVIISSPPFPLLLCSTVFWVFRERDIVHDIRDLYPQVFAWKNIFPTHSVSYKILLKLTRLSLANRKCIGATYGISNLLIKDFQLKNVSTYLNGSSFAAEDSRKEKANQKGEFTVIYHGTLGKVQSLNDIEYIVRSCQNTNFKFFTDLDRLGNSFLRYASNVQLHSRIDEGKLIDEIKNAHMLLSVRDNSKLTQISNPVKIFDALVLGTPVVSIPETEINKITNGSAMLVSCSHDNISAIISVINKCSLDFTYYENMFPDYGIASRQYERPNILPSTLRNL